MAIINSLAVGKARKSAGNLTFSTVNGRTIAREKATFVRNPNTAGQQKQRARMAAVVAGWRAIASPVKKLWTVKNKYSSEYNAFVSANIANAEKFAYDADAGTIKAFEGLQLGNGKFPQSAVINDSTAVDEYEVLITNQEIRNSAKVGDVVGVIIVNADTGEMKVKEVALQASDLPLNAGSIFVIADDSGFTNKLYSCYYYSKARNESTTVVLSK